ncbi:winged helix DNA-binding domain-containing protein [Streptomyces sp. ISL-98]|uniref:DNA glycosylase AlkZ-like family protein n=1 Tax=Streptomyces sp. ISL-98 TaxID=2819192 RepID=UPI001BEB20BE|nr:crosslink repair DNA glycosylase YcaQ family protein [Streptomyces sp. ISL-98]MBT2507719.1 winged helix DNA-binding domain-containing protein [Streptomyces sp. ISL-98]
MSNTHRIEVSREQVLAYRMAAHGFDRSSPAPDVLVIGAQDTPIGSARQALAARRASLDGLELVWSFRGAPHLHRRADLSALAAALWPLDDADATARIDTAVIKEGARLGIEAFRVTAEAFREVVTAPMPKGEVSTAVSASVPESLTYWCARCGAQHISGLLFQQAGIFGGIGVRSEGGRTILAPLGERFPVPAEASGTTELVRAYLRFLGPATPAEVAKYLGTKPTVVKTVWPENDLAEVWLNGKKAWLPASDLDALLSAESQGLVRLLPPGDPFLQARDRGLVVPDKSREKEIWRAIGGPGALLVGSEIAGTWRAKATGRKLDLTVTPFGPLSSAVRRELDAEAATVASARGAAEPRLHIARSDG